ncbi:unnamed protein product [Moneuplotes crassus]|uniref:BZIP domain-containing protein n=1 Tax=Euplotes crassus TaxID=5936 RepID=A0AAD2CZ75_EUPCR|nr:unnamed protein product [Moneuplotes crassus]
MLKSSSTRKTKTTRKTSLRKSKKSTDIEVGSHTPSSSQKGSSDYCPESTDIRLKKNRESACRSRLKKKQQISHIQEEYDIMVSENTRIQQNIDCCSKRIEKLEDYNARIRKSIEYMQAQQNLILVILSHQGQAPSLSLEPLQTNLNDLISERRNAAKQEPAQAGSAGGLS